MRIIGKPHRRVDALGKVTGRARFAADLSAPAMLWGAVLRVPCPHARLIAIDTRAARGAPGVAAVLTAADIPGAKRFGGIVANQPVLAFDKVRQYGDGVAIVAAETRAAAQDAAARIAVELEELPGVFDPEEALRPDAPVVHQPAAPPSEPAHADAPDAPNLCAHHRIRKGDPAVGFAAAHLVLERTYRTQPIEHAYLEPEAVLAEPEPEGGVRVTGSIQNIFSTRRAMAAVLNLDLARVTVKQATLGGSFGGKDEVMSQLACRAALLALATGRPVKMVYTREESLIESYKRHPYVLHYRAGVDRDGRLLAIEARILADAGAYAATSPFVTWRSAVQVTGPYACPHVHADVMAVYTNNVYTGAMRGFGAPQVNFAVESLVDELAEQLGIDPLELRLRNVLGQGDRTATGQKLDGHRVSIGDVLRRAAAAADWERARRELPAAASPTRARGIGVACSFRGVSLGAEGVDAVGAIVSVQTDGSILISLGLVDMGQGLSSAMALIAAEVLGVGLERIRCFCVHTGRVPDSGPTVASRSTIMGGQAVKKAAEAVRGELLAVAAQSLGAAYDDLRCEDGAIGDGRGHAITFVEAAARAHAAGRPLLGFGWHHAPQTDWDERHGTGQAYFTFVYSANVAEVEVDLETGQVEVMRVVAAHDVGRAISPAMVRNQIYGGVAMGCGYGLWEEHRLTGGVPRTLNLNTYLLPTAMDAPEVDAIIVENPDPAGPFGAKSVGEPATEITAPAVVNAIAHATSRRVRELPADLEAVLLGHHLRADDPGPSEVS